MPFNSVDDLPPNPNIRIFFVGQLILEPLKYAQGCEVYINRSAPDHHLSIEVRRKKVSKPDEIVMRHFGPLPFTQVRRGVPPRHGMFIEVVGNPSPVPPQQPSPPAPPPPEVHAYNGTNPSPEGEELDLALNMFRIHDVPCEPVEPIGGRPSILIKGCTFYTADTFPAGATLRKRRSGSWPKPQPKFAGIIGANFYLTGTQQVVMKWQLNGRDLLFPFPKIPGQTHEIYISNEPLFQEDNIQSPFSHDEFSEFYKILRNVPSHEQFILEIPPERGSLRTPCMSVLLDQ
jgi:hypothetical protein